MPTIAFSGSYDQAAATQVGGGDTVAVPELAILSVIPFRRALGAQLNPPLQHATAWGATKLLRMVGLPCGAARGLRGPTAREP